MGACCSSRDGSMRSKPNIRAVSEKSRQALANDQLKNSKLESFVQMTIDAGKPWTDPDFPPQKSSLYDASIDTEVD